MLADFIKGGRKPDVRKAVENCDTLRRHLRMAEDRTDGSDLFIKMPFGSIGDSMTDRNTLYLKE